VPAVPEAVASVHAYHRRRLLDLPVAGRGSVIDLRVRRPVCQNTACAQRAFREQVPGLTQQWGRRTVQLTHLVGQVAVALAARSNSRLRFAR